MRSAVGMTCLAAGITLAGCGSAVDPAAEREALLAADRAFAQATAERRLEGWVEAFAEDAIMMRPDEPFSPGLDAVRGYMAGAFADTSWTISWEPELAFVSSAGDMGYTLGRYRTRGLDAAGAEMLGAGKYVTIWRKGQDGRWRVVFDGGNPDTQP